MKNIFEYKFKYYVETDKYAARRHFYICGYGCSDYTMAMAAVVIAVLPIAILFLIWQKYFIKRMTMEAVKGQKVCTGLRY